MKKKVLFLTATFFLFGAGTASAGPGDLNIAIRGGTLGGGGEVTTGLGENIDARFGVNYLRFSFHSTISNIDYEMEPEFKNGSLLLDWYPFSGAFKITGGIFLNNNEISVTGTARSEMLPAELSPLAPLADSVTINGTVEFNTLAPYAGIGWNSNSEQEQGWGVAFEMGVLFQGSPKVNELYIIGPEAFADYSSRPEIVAALELERKAIEDDLDKFQYYPVATLMLNYTF